MRTTLNLHPDAFQAAKAKAAHENVSLGQAVSELILQAIRPTSASSRRGTSDGIFRSGSGVYGSAEVEEALDDE
ncbi:MAG: CopG family transcriptional regulator [Limisphaerales bacterium]